MDDRWNGTHLFGRALRRRRWNETPSPRSTWRTYSARVIRCNQSPWRQLGMMHLMEQRWMELEASSINHLATRRLPPILAKKLTSLPVIAVKNATTAKHQLNSTTDGGSGAESGNNRLQTLMIEGEFATPKKKANIPLFC